MAWVPLMDVTAGLMLAGVALFVLSRGGRATGALLALAAATWFAGYGWPAAGLAHRLPLAAALFLNASGLSRRRETWLAVGAALAAALCAVRPSGWTTVAVGVAVAIAAHAQIRGSSTRAGLPALVFGYGLAALGGLWLLGTAGSVTSAGYALTVLSVAMLLWRRVAQPPTPHVVVQLASGDSDELTSRLKLLLGDPRLALDLGDGVPQLLPGTSVVALTRAGEVVGHLRHSRDRRPSRRLEGGLTALAGLLRDARGLRARSLATLVELDAAHEDFRSARERGAATLSARLRSGPMTHLMAARTNITEPGLLSELDEAWRELEVLSEELADPSRGAEDWQPALARRVALSPIPVTAHVQRDLGQVSARAGHAALLGCAEALSNAAKHSHARSVALTVALVGRVLNVTVSDDGRGGADAHGFGLRGIRERMERHGGGFNLDSRPGAGTVVHFWLPCEDTP